MEINFSFALEQNIKVIKPNTPEWKALIKVGEDAVLGFFVGGSYGYSL